MKEEKLDLVGYQVIGLRFGPTITIWPTLEIAKQYLQDIRSISSSDEWRIIKVNIKRVSNS